MKVLFFAPFPPPLHGHSLMSRVAYQGLSSRCEVTKVDTTMEREFSGNKLHKLSSVRYIGQIIATLYRDVKIMISKRYSLYYMAVGISFRGFMRYAPYMLWAIASSTPYLLHTHGSTFNKMYGSQGWIKRKIIHFLASRAARIIVLSDSLKESVKDVATDSVRVCHNCVEEYIFISDEEISNKVAGKRLLFLSNVMYAKGIVELMDAFKLLDDSYCLDIAGEIEPDKALETLFREFCQSYPNRVTYHGGVYGEAKRDLLIKSDIFVLPSHNEGQPVSILEAYASGLAVATDESVGGIKDIFSSEDNGVSFSYSDTSSIAKAIEECSRDLDRYSRYNIATARESYTPESFSERLYNILKDCE